MTEVTTKWERAGLGLWRRERGVSLRVRENLRGGNLVVSVGALRAEVMLGPTTVIRDRENEAEGKLWCDRWATILLQEASRDR